MEPYFHIAQSGGKAATPRVGLIRLERLARILEDAHKTYKLLPPVDVQEIDIEVGIRSEVQGYTQRLLAHHCGTPACALGHYAYHTPARFSWEHAPTPARDWGKGGDWDDGIVQGLFPQASHEFCLTTGERHALFETRGCGEAKNALEAAKYIRKFVARKRKELGLKKPVKK